MAITVAQKDEIEKQIKEHERANLFGAVIGFVVGLAIVFYVKPVILKMPSSGFFVDVIIVLILTAAGFTQDGKHKEKINELKIQLKDEVK